MQNKFEFVTLPEELQIATAQNLSNRELVNLSMTSKYHLNLFQPLIDVRKLLHHVTRGQPDPVKAMLKKDMSLIFKRGTVTDCSAREFENISGFEYALWALDKHMWAAMIACIPQDEEGRKVFAQLIAQYNKVNTDGVTYKLNGQTITEQHFDFKHTIIKELLIRADSIKSPRGDAIDKQWREGVVGAIKLLPVHAVDNYCSQEPYDPLPSQPNSLNLFYNRATEKDENCFSVGSKLAIDFAIYKERADLVMRFAKLLLTCRDTKSPYYGMLSIYDTGRGDFIALKSQLEDQMTLDNHHQVSEI